MNVRRNRPDKEARRKERRSERILSIFKALVLLVLLGATAYGVIRSGLYDDKLWLPVATGTLALLFLTLFIRNFFADINGIGWLLVGLLATLVAVKGLSMYWTVSEAETVQELLRSSMYLAVFVLALAAVSSERQVAPLMDAAILIVSIVAGYGVLQKVRPVEYGITSIDGFRVDSTLDYANTAAMMLGVGVALALARMTSSRNPLIRGLYAAIALCCVTVLFLTASRGGIFSLGIGVLVFLVITSDRLQALANVFLLSIPGAALIWSMQSLDGLLEVGASEARKVADGTTFGVYLLVAMIVAFVLQAVYALVMNLYELTDLSRRSLNMVAGVLAVLILVTGVFLTVNRYGGVGKAYESLTEGPENNGNIGQRLASLSIGYREDYWKVGWASWKQNPLTGTGAGTFQFTWLKERDSDTGVKQIHNLYLEQGTETGVFAFAALLGFVGLLVGYTIRATLKSGLDGERRVLLAGLVSALLVYLISSVIEWHWYIPASTMYFFILAAVAVKLAASPEWLTPKAASPIRTVVHEPLASKTDSASPNG